MLNNNLEYLKNINSNHTYLEVCAGCGGLSSGLELAGLKSIALIEIDK